MNLSYKLYAIADAKVFCSILYSFGNIQMKYYCGPVGPVLVSLSWKKSQYPEG